MAGIQQLLGQNIRILRKQRGWTQAELAEKINVTTPFMTLVERGQRGVSLSTVEDLASVFEVTLSTLFSTTITNDFEKIKPFQQIANISSLEENLKEKILALVTNEFEAFKCEK